MEKGEKHDTDRRRAGVEGTKGSEYDRKCTYLISRQAGGVHVAGGRVTDGGCGRGSRGGECGGIRKSTYRIQRRGSGRLEVDLPGVPASWVTSQPEGQLGGTWCTQEEGRRGTGNYEWEEEHRERGRGGDLVTRIEISAVCGPIGRGSGFPRVQRIGEPPDIALGGGEGNFPTRISGKGSVRAPERFGGRRSLWMMTRPRHQQRRRKFARMLRIVRRKGQRETQRRLENSPVEANIFYLWRVEPKNSRHQELGFPTNPLTRTWYPVRRLKTPPKPLLVLG